MASTTPISQSNLFSTNTHFKTIKSQQPNLIYVSFRNPSFQSKVLKRNFSVQGNPVRRVGGGGGGGGTMPLRNVVVSATMAETQKKRYPGEGKGFVEEMRFVAMKLHTKDQAKEGEKETQEKPLAKWEPTIEGYLQFLVDSKLVYDTLETIVQKAAYPAYAEFRNTGLERSEKLAKDLEWFKERGHAIPEPSTPGLSYAQLLEDMSVNDPQAFICHFYNVYFAHSAGGRMIGKKVAEKILDKKELEFYKWDGDLSELLQNVREKLNKVAESWSREEKNHCLEETEKSFKYSGQILRLILT